MKPCAFIGQSLTDHLEGCFKVVDTFFEKNPTYANVVARRLRTASGGQINLNEDRIKTIIKLAVLFHDVGKAYGYFQRNFDERCQCKREIGFQHHEILSAVACYKYGRYNGNSLSNEEKLLLTLSVLNHHHAFKDAISKIVTSIPIIGTLLDDLAKIAESQIYENENLKSILKKYNIPVESVKISRQDINNFQNWLSDYIKRISVNQYQWPKLYVLIMNPLLIADNIDASSKREKLQISKSRKLFLEEIREMIK